MPMRNLLLIQICLFFIPLIFAQNKITVKYADKDTNHLFLDIYQPENINNSESYPCFIYVFGGGFMTGRRDDTTMVKAFEALTEKGFVVVAIDYRLGLKGVKNLGVSSVNILEHAIRIAVEDLYSATDYICQNCKKYQIDTSKIIISGSSAGAVTVLQADWWLHKGDESAKILPQGFRYAGVVSFSGAILSFEGKLKYQTPPAPTFFYHGIDDKLVTYKQIVFANLGLFGSSKIVERFEKFGYSYHIKRMKNHGHEVAIMFPYFVNEIEAFYKDWIIPNKQWQIDETWYDPEYQPIPWGKMKPKDIYK